MSILDDSTVKCNAAACGEQNIQGASSTRPNLQDHANGNGSNRTEPTVAVVACVPPRTMLDLVREERERVLRAYWRSKDAFEMLTKTNSINLFAFEKRISRSGIAQQNNGSRITAKRLAR